MASGGARPGAGRKPGLQAEAYRKALLDLVDVNRDGLAKALVEKGLIGDVPALKEINERVLGKVPMPIDSGDGEVSLPVLLVVKQQTSVKPKSRN